MKRGVVCLVVLVFLVSISACASDVRYAITDLGPISALSISDAGQVAGCSEDYYPLLWNDGTIVQLQPSSQKGFAYAISKGGQVVGKTASAARNGGMVAATWDLQGHVTYLSTGSAEHGSTAHDINDQGLIVGCFMDSNWLGHACYWQGGVRTDLVPPYGRQSLVRSVNNVGDILVEAWDTRSRMYIYRQGEYLPVLVDVDGISGFGVSDINDKGVVVGAAGFRDNTSVPFIWQDGVTTLLPKAAGMDRSSILATNNSGTMVGFGWSNRLEAARACVWTGQQVSYLDDVISPGTGWALEYAKGINDHGQIVGYGTLDGVRHGYLLTPLPEPASCLALAMGAGYVLVSLRRRRL